MLLLPPGDGISSYGDAGSQRLAEFKMQLALTVAEWGAVKARAQQAQAQACAGPDGGGGDGLQQHIRHGMPLGLLPKKYEQLWGTPLPASEALGCAHASPPWSRVRVVVVASAHWGPTVFGLAWTRVILGHYCLLPELFMCLRTVGCDRGSAC